MCLDMHLFTNISIRGGVQRVIVYILIFALMSKPWKPILSNYFRILQSQGLWSRTVISKLSTDFPNILLMATDYLPVPRRSMRSTIAMFAQILKYVQQCEIMHGRFLQLWAQIKKSRQQIDNFWSESKLRRVEQCENFVAAQQRLPATRRQQSGGSNPQPGVSNQPINQQSRQSLVAASRHSIQREAGDTKMPILGEGGTQTVLRSTEENQTVSLFLNIFTLEPIICESGSSLHTKQVSVFRFVWLLNPL